MRVALMQPYWCTAAGYFRLLACTDLFIFHDTAQFIKGGWIHRNKLRLADGSWAWCTLPIKVPRSTSQIREMEWQLGEKGVTEKQKRRFPVLWRNSHYYMPLWQPVGYIAHNVGAIAKDLRCGAEIKFASGLGGIDPCLGGQDQVIDICRSVGATEYVNAPGGRSLYDSAAFAAAGIKLKILCDYPNHESVVERIAQMGATAVRAEIDEYCRFDS